MPKLVTPSEAFSKEQVPLSCFKIRNYIHIIVNTHIFIQAAESSFLCVYFTFYIFIYPRQSKLRWWAISHPLRLVITFRRYFRIQEEIIQGVKLGPNRNKSNSIGFSIWSLQSVHYISAKWKLPINKGQIQILSVFESLCINFYFLNFPESSFILFFIKTQLLICAFIVNRFLIFEEYSNSDDPLLICYWSNFPLFARIRNNNKPNDSFKPVQV